MTARRGERYTDGEIATIRRLAGEKRTDEEIGLLLGRGMPSIKQLRLRLGIEAGGGAYDPAPSIEPDLVERIRTLAEKGWSDERIGRETGRTLSQIMRMRRRFGIECGNPGCATDNLPKTISAEARREAHIAMLRERKAARRAAEMKQADA